MNFRVRQSSPRVISFLALCGVSLAAVFAYLNVVPPAAYSMVATFTVNSTADTVDAVPGNGVCQDAGGNCTLRAAVMEANALGGADTIALPAGTYTLSLGGFDDEANFDGARADIGDLDVLGSDLTINGAGPASTIIDGGGIDRIIEVNDFAGPGVAVNLTITGVTLRNGNTHVGDFGYFAPGGAIQFDGFGIGGPSNKRLTLDNCKVTGNRSDAQGGGISVIFGALTINNTEISSNESTHATGGGVSYDAGSAAAAGRTLEITNNTFSSNHAPDPSFGDGGGLQLGGNVNSTVENNTFSGNSAGANGGGISGGAPLASNSKAIRKNRFETNSAKSGGGVFNRNGSTTFELNVVVGNTATTDASGTGYREGASTTLGSIATLTNNWWGCNDGPGFSPCDRAAGSTGGFISGPWLTLSHAATPSSVEVNTPTSLQSDFFTPSSGAPVLAADLTALNGRAIVFNNAFLGTISAADTQILGGKANATFTAGATGGNGSADATVDHATVTANISITQAAVITCPSDITVNAETGQCSATVSFSTTATGFPAPTTTCKIGSTTITSPHVFPVGTTTVDCTASNGSSPDASCSFHVTVNDTQNPTVTAPANVTVNTGPGAASCSVMVSESTLGTANASDNCSGVSLDRTGVPAGNLFPVGVTTITYTATDANGNHAVATQSVTVIDNTPPLITSCAPPQSAGANGSGQAAVPNFTSTVVAADNCAVTSITQSPAAGTLVGIGTTTVTITVKDAANNTATCNTSFTVTAGGPQLTVAGPSKIWIGLKNSDDVGTKFDLLAEGLKNGVVIASGQLNDVPGGSSGFNNAVLRTINMALTGGPVNVATGNTLSLRLSVRVAASSNHVSGTARLWYNDSSANSRVQATIGGVPLTGYLVNGFTFNGSPGSGPKKTIDVTVNRNQGGNPWKPFGTWNVTVP